MSAALLAENEPPDPADSPIVPYLPGDGLVWSRGCRFRREATAIVRNNDPTTHVADLTRSLGRLAQLCPRDPTRIVGQESRPFRESGRSQFAGLCVCVLHERETRHSHVERSGAGRAPAHTHSHGTKDAAGARGDRVPRLLPAHS